MQKLLLQNNLNYVLLLPYLRKKYIALLPVD
jgi:hypothetical protein